jgi:hypothetical protein
MPRRINWKIMDELYDIYPKNYEEIISQEGVGPSTIEAGNLVRLFSKIWQRCLNKSLKSIIYKYI